MYTFTGREHWNGLLDRQSFDFIYRGVTLSAGWTHRHMLSLRIEVTAISCYRSEWLRTREIIINSQDYYQLTCTHCRAGILIELISVLWVEQDYKRLFTAEDSVVFEAEKCCEVQKKEESIRSWVANAGWLEAFLPEKVYSWQDSLSSECVCLLKFQA